jgi:hypothetical protein
MEVRGVWMLSGGQSVMGSLAPEIRERERRNGISRGQGVNGGQFDVRETANQLEIYSMWEEGARGRRSKGIEEGGELSRRSEKGADGVEVKHSGQQSPYVC